MTNQQLVKAIEIEAKRIGEHRAAIDLLNLKLGISTTAMLIKGQYRGSAKWIAPKLELALKMWAQAA